APQWHQGCRVQKPAPEEETRNLAADVQSRLPFLRRRKNSACVHGNSLEKALRNNRPSPGEVLRWSENLEALLTNQYGLAVFRHFLRSEFSEENLDFWLAVERFKRTRPLSKMAARAAKIYEEFISTNAARQVNVDSSVRESTNQSLHLGVSPRLLPAGPGSDLQPDGGGQLPTLPQVPPLHPADQSGHRDGHRVSELEPSWHVSQS
ncbi:Regulator of G-protein signaling 3, partial [Larimichthys crocea]